MHTVFEFVTRWYGTLYNVDNLAVLVQWGGYLLLAAIVFAETGLLAGFFLPGDSLLFIAGFLVGTGALRPPSPLPQEGAAGFILLELLLMAAAFTGNSTGYWVGAKAGPALFNRPDSHLFTREHLLKTREFYERHGGKTIILAEFMPFARTFAPVVAGVAQMRYRTFMSFNVIGVVIWVLTMTSLGFLLGGIELVRHHLEKAVILIILLSISPAILHVVKARRRACRRPGLGESPGCE